MPCHRDPALGEMYALVRSEALLEDRLNRLKHQVSDASLAQMPDFNQRVQVLRQLDYISAEDVVELKVRTACCSMCVFGQANVVCTFVGQPGLPTCIRFSMHPTCLVCGVLTRPAFSSTQVCTFDTALPGGLLMRSRPCYVRINFRAGVNCRGG